MRDFIERIKNDWNDEWAYKQEPLFFKAFLWPAMIIYWIVKVIFIILAGITSPLWIVPYMIVWIRKNKKQNSNSNANTCVISGTVSGVTIRGGRISNNETIDDEFVF